MQLASLYIVQWLT